MAVLFTNNAITTLAGGISSSATTVNVATGTGALYASPSGGNYQVATLVAAANSLVFEIVHVTSRSGDALTILRAQEGTSALAWLTGDTFAALVTAGVLAAMNQSGAVGSATYAVDSGSANAMVAVFGYTPSSLAGFTGIALQIQKGSSANTGSATLAVNGFTATAVVHGDGTALVLDELPNAAVFTVVFNGTNFVLQSNAFAAPLFQTAYDVTGSRALSSPFTNATGKPMFVGVTALSTGANGNLVLTVNGLTAAVFGQPNNGGASFVSGMVPAGATYEVSTTVAGFTLSDWTETY